MDDFAIKAEGVTKQYRLGTIGGGTLKGDLQSAMARLRGKDDPNAKIGAKAYARNEKFLALDDVSFEVKPGEALGIIGHNGAGKSTLLKILSRVTAPTKGQIEINGRIASMLEVGTGFHPELTGRENVYLNGAILGMTKAEIKRKFDDIVEFAEMEQFIDTPVKRYSSGMYVKLAFSVAAHLDSEIMVMDEVLAVGDMKFQQKCLGKMGDAAGREGRTVLYVSHNMNTIRQLCTRCLVLDHGKKIFDGKTEEAIAMYMKENNIKKQYYEYSSEFHKSNKTVDDFTIVSLKYDDNSKNIFNINDRVKLHLKCNSTKVRKEVNFRFEIHSSSGQAIGTMCTRSGVDFFTEEKEITMILDTEHLAPGLYNADIVAYVKNEYGTEDFLDGVYPGIAFEIGQSGGIIELTWKTGPWGYIKLHDILMEE